MKLFKKSQKGFTMIELVVVLAIMATLLGLVFINLLGSKQRASGASSLDVLISDIRSQQLKAMLGDSEGRLSNDAYGILLSTASYTLFHGPTYNGADTSNVVIPLGDGTTLQNITFPQTRIIFASGSGELANYVFGATSFTISTVGGTQRTIQLNKYGTVTYVN